MLRKQLLWGLAGFLALFVLANGVALYALESTSSHFGQFMETQLVLQSRLQDGYAQGLQMGQALRNILLDPANKTAYENLAKAQQDFDTALSEAAAVSAVLKVHEKELTEVATLAGKQRDMQKELLRQIQQGNRPAAEQILNQQETPVWREIKKRLLDALNALAESNQAEKLNVQAQAQSALWTGSLLSLLTAVFVAGGGYWLFRRIFQILGGEPAEAARLVRRVAGGDLSVEFDPNVEPTSLIGSLAQLVTAIRSLTAEMRKVCDAATLGHLSERSAPERYQGEYRRILQGFNETLDAMTGPLHVAADYVDRIAHGDIPPLITEQYAGEFNLLRKNLNTCIAALERMDGDVLQLARAAREGRLSARADTAAHEGAFRNIVAGFNGTLDAVTGPLGIAADYVDRIARGDLPPKITEEFAGDFNIIKNNLNAAIDNVNALVTDVHRLALAAVEGQLSVRADAPRHHGDYRRIVEGVNGTLDAIVGPIRDVSEALAALAQGDLTHEIEASYQGDFARLKDDVNTTIRNLGLSVKSIQEATDAIHSAAREIAQSSSELSSRIEEQASGLEQAATQMDVLAATVKRNAGNAGQADRMAKTASEVAGRGGTIIHKVMETMEEIDKSSRKVVEIIAVIDGIAFQTNILALNAAVEAARAGEHGRGFAVVAAEVRNLAQRSASAAKEIHTLIGESVKKVEGGAKLERETGETMDEIVGAVNQVTGIITGIAEESRAQSDGIGLVNQAVARVGVVTQQNTALVEMTAMSAESLEMQVASLSELVSHFRVAEAGNATATTRPAQSLPPPEPGMAPPPPTASVVTDEDDWSQF